MGNFLHEQLFLDGPFMFLDGPFMSVDVPRWSVFVGVFVSNLRQPFRDISTMLNFPKTLFKSIWHYVRHSIYISRALTNDIR